ncbi:MAG: hypothetical protein J1F38_05645 [Muribaculaceae bacterium]|nr:hypothetical protein [Muribaculaceae bacterium]
MKKIFTFLLAFIFVGIFNAKSVEVEVEFTGVENAQNYVTVYEVKNSVSNSDKVEWANVEVSNMVEVADGTNTELIINPNEGYFLSGNWSPLQSSGVSISEINNNNLFAFSSKGGKIGGLVISLKTGDFGNIYEGTVVTINVTDGTEEKEPEVPYSPIELYFDIPDETPGLIQQLSFLGESVEFEEDDDPYYYTVKFNNQVNGSAPLFIQFRSNEEGELVYNVSHVDAYYIMEPGGNPIPCSVNLTGGMATIIIQEVANSVFVSFVIGVPGKDYMEYTVNVNYPEGIVITNNEGEEVALSGNNNVIRVEKIKTEVVDGGDEEEDGEEKAVEERYVYEYDVINIIAKSGYAIKSVTNSNGLPIANYETRIELYDGLVLNVDVEEKAVVYGNFTVIFEPDVFESAYYTTNGTTQIPLENINGENVITYDANTANRYQINVQPKTENAIIYPFVDGLSAGEILTEYSNTVYFGLPQDGMVIRLYVNKPESYKLLFTADNAAVNNTNVSLDGQDLKSWTSAAGNLALEGVELQITTASDIEVMLNEEKQTPESDSNGISIYVYTIESDMSFSLSSPTEDGDGNGIEEIITNPNQTITIYNLQGVRIAGPDNLKPGLYIINGKKVIIR